jgi:AraC-like DNA-binding protein
LTNGNPCKQSFPHQKRQKVKTRPVPDLPADNDQRGKIRVFYPTLWATQILHSALAKIAEDSPWDHSFKMTDVVRERVISSKKLMDESVTRENVRELSLEDICQLCQLNVFNLNRGFWALYGNSPMQYYYELKFNLALSLLAETDESITHISNLMNFNNVAYFCLLFKRKFNETPSQNRDRVKRKKGRKR